MTSNLHLTCVTSELITIKVIRLASKHTSSLAHLVPIFAAKANVLEDYVERSQRPTMTNEQALVKLLDARGILYELKVK